MMKKKKEMFILQNSEKDKEKKEIIINKKKGCSTGRIKKFEKKKGKHNNLSNDNVTKKIKGKVFSCIHSTLNNIIKRFYKKNKKKFKCQKKSFLKKISYTFIKDGHKNYNIEFLNKQIKDIYLFQISSKYKEKENNIEIIEKFSSDELFKEIIDMTFSEFINRIFMMKSSEFEAKYSFYNKYLFENLQIEDEEEKSIIKNLIGYGLLNYFNKIKERNKKTLNNNTTKMCTDFNNNDKEEESYEIGFPYCEESEVAFNKENNEYDLFGFFDLDKEI